MRHSVGWVRRLTAVCLVCIAIFLSAGCMGKPRPAQPGTQPPAPQSPAPVPPPALKPTLRDDVGFPNGVTGCWALADGSVLIESPGKVGKQYSCLVTAEDCIKPVTPDSWDCTVKEISADSLVFIRRNSPAGMSPDIVTFSVKTLEQTGTQPAGDLTVRVAKQPSVRPELEPASTEDLHDSLARFIGKVQYCRLLPDGTVLLASVDQTFIFRWYPKHNVVAFVAGDAYMGTLIDVDEQSFKLVCYGDGPTAMRTFPYLLTYDLRTNTHGKQEQVYLPVTAGVEVGWPKDSREIVLSDVKIGANSLDIVAEDTMWQEPAEYLISSDPETHELVIRMPGTQAKGVELPLTLTNASGLIQKVQAESGVIIDGASHPGVTVHVSLDPAKWDLLTYDCAAWNPFRLTIYDNREPTDISVKVGP